jgi:DNA-binding transcriptional ArsR family regulator
VIDRLRKEIQERLDQLLTEAEKLRKALTALNPRGGSSSAQPEAPRPARAATTRQGARASAAPGHTKSVVLAALADGKAMTAGEVAAATGLARPTVSTTLSKLAKNGEVQKAERGYRLPRTGGSKEPEDASG